MADRGFGLLAGEMHGLHKFDARLGCGAEAA